METLSGSVSNCNKRVLYTPQNSRIGASPPVAVWCHKPDSPFLWLVLLLVSDTVSIF